MQRLLVWDAPVRVVHWSIAACVLVAWLTRDARDIDVHAAAGYTAAALCLFRIAWGFVGTRHARFRDFAYSPRAALGYLRALARREAGEYAGHNPAGSWSVHALLALQLGIAGTGIAAVAGMHGLGPLAGHVGHSTADTTLAWHEGLAWAMLAVIGLHILGVLASSLAHRENLVAAMVTGRKRARPPAGAEHSRSGLAAALVAGAILLGGGYIAASGTLLAVEERRAPGVSVALDPLWKAECESCHLPYAPCLLPPRSWEAMLEGAENHFGEDLALAEETIDALMQPARAAPVAEPWACWKTRSSISDGTAPLRISETPYWKQAHESLAAKVFEPPASHGAHDCGACHRDAASSIFHPRMIHISQ